MPVKQRDAQWRVLSFRTGHTHALEQLPERALTGQKTMRAGIPEKFMPIGQAMQSPRIEVSRIHTALTINAQYETMPITWTYADVRHAFSLNTADRALDAQTLHEWIKLRSTCRGLDGAVLESARRFKACYFEMEDARPMRWSKSMHSDVL